MVESPQKDKKTKKEHWKIRLFKKLPLGLKVWIMARKLPTSFIVEATNICNHKCPMCPWHTIMKRKLEHMDFERFSQILSKIEKHAKAISFYLMGEPFLNKDIFKMIKACAERGIKTHISSNTMLVGHYVDDILNSGLTSLQMVLDGFSPETHEKYRVGGKFNVVIENIKKITAEKKRRGLKYPRLRVQTLVFKHNQHEIGKIVDFLKEIGVDEYAIKAPNMGRELDKTDKLISDFLPDDAYFQRLQNKDDSRYYKNMGFCPQFSQCSILAGGEVAPCCFDFDGKYSWGNVLEKTLEDVWKAPKRLAFLRAYFKKKNPLCNSCDFVDEYAKSMFTNK
ncbi:radical SAM protein [Candidatus Uhrbacteria bacterium]|nr:radical SAM protein [Candidatus Uhrbacteria bacterium]